MNHGQSPRTFRCVLVGVLALFLGMVATAEDDDGDEDEEDYRVSWDMSSDDDYVDELDGREA